MDVEKRGISKDDEVVGVATDVDTRSILFESDTSTVGKQDVLSHEDLDPALTAKMHLVNNVSPRHNMRTKSSTRRICLHAT